MHVINVQWWIPTIVQYDISTPNKLRAPKLCKVGEFIFIENFCLLLGAAPTKQTAGQITQLVRRKKAASLNSSPKPKHLRQDQIPFIGERACRRIFINRLPTSAEI